ncbi:MATE family efflux transporter [Selenomonas dianae]|nr:MATE family efflux transporter [Selenomonas dianae]WLD82682.1 MATE family efflux transporter [Selenomonas dianae]
MKEMLSKLHALKRHERIYGIRNPLTYDFLHHNLHHLHVLLFHSADQQDFTRGAIVRQLLIFMLPILLSQLLQQFYTIADTALVGQVLGAEALAAVGTSSLVLSVMVNFFIGFSAGLSVLVSHLYGEKQYDRLSALVQSIFVTVITFAVLFTAAGILLTEPLLTALSTPADLIPQAGLYLRIALGGMLAQLLYNTAAAILRALGNTTSALHYLAVAVVLNIALDVLLLIVIPCGIAGAAMATVAAQYVSALLALHKLLCLRGAWQLRLTRPFFTPRHLLPILGTSIPAGLQAVFMSISSLVIQTYINSFGYAAMAGMTVYARIEGFLYYPLFAFGIALTSFIGQNVGAHDLARVREGLRMSLRIAAGGAMGMALAAGLAAPALIALFTDDPAVVANALDAVYYTFPFYFLYGINQIYIGALRGLGDTLYPMLTALAAYCIFRVAWCFAWDIVGIHSMHIVYSAYSASFFVMAGLLWMGCRRALRRTSVQISI